MLKLNKKKLCIATSVFHLRKTRPLSYYMKPVNHFLEDMKNTDIEVVLYTDQNPKLFHRSKNIEIIESDPDSFISYYWDNKDWKEEYSANQTDRLEHLCEERDVPSLVSIWLGKTSMMEYAATKADHVLWFDSGFRMNIWRKCPHLYTRCYHDPEIFKKTIENILTDHDIAFANYIKSNVKKLHGVNMHKYKKDAFNLAALLACRSEKATWLKEQVKEKWNFLIENNEYGTEENALTLIQWDNDFPSFGLGRWMDMLRIGWNNKKRQHD